MRVLTEVCAQKFRSKLEMSNGGVPCREAKDGIVAFVERRRASSIRPAPMDIRNQEEREEHT